MRFFITLPIALYRLLISPILGRNCRYHPSCSAYMQQAIHEYGLFKGGWLGLKRLSHCHPWGDKHWHNKQGYDPVPFKDNNNVE